MTKNNENEKNKDENSNNEETNEDKKTKDNQDNKITINTPLASEKSTNENSKKDKKQIRKSKNLEFEVDTKIQEPKNTEGDEKTQTPSEANESEKNIDSETINEEDLNKEKTEEAETEPSHESDNIEDIEKEVHSHDHMGDWDTLATHKYLKFIMLFLAFILVATTIGFFFFLPTGKNRSELDEQSRTLGLSSELYTAEIKEISEGQCSYSSPEDPQICKTVIIEPHGGSKKGSLHTLSEYNEKDIVSVPNVRVGEKIIVGYEKDTQFYFYYDKQRSSSLFLLTIVFVVAVLILARKKGIFALLSMLLTVLILFGFVAPSILEGNDPALVAIVGASIIAFISLYLTHGFTPSTTVALAGTLAALLITLFFASIFLWLGQFTGLADESNLTVKLLNQSINMPSLLLAGAVLGALGALDDITVTQVAIISELHHRKPSLTISELFTSGIRIGREHIASTVNTLLLAYAGASLPIILLASMQSGNNNLDSVSTTLSEDLGFFSRIFHMIEQQFNILNAEPIAVEFIRTLTGSIGLIAAVPATSFFAAVLIGTSGIKEKQKNKKEA